MLVVTGIFKDDTLVPDSPVILPQQKRVIVTIEEEKESSGQSFKELSMKAKILRSRIEAETGVVDVCSLINEGRTR